MSSSVTLSVDGMSCEGCAGSVSKILQRVPGVVSVSQVSVKEKNAKINVDQSFKSEEAVQSLGKAGFTAKQL